MEKIPFMQTRFHDEDAYAVFNQIKSGFIGPGTSVKELSESLAFENMRKNCQLTTSGTIALSVAAIAAGLKKGDEILVPAYGVISTIHAFTSIGLLPRLVDIDINTASISVQEISKSITKQTRAICYVNFAGNTGQDLVDIEKFCKDSNLILIEDAACALGNSFKGRMAGSFGNVSTYSFSAPKVITTGQGGAILTDDEKIFKYVNEVIDLGDTNWRKTNINRNIGSNLRYTNLQAELGKSQLKFLKNKLKNRKNVFSILKNKLKNKIYESDGLEAPLYNIILTEHRLEIKDFFKKNLISTNIQYRAIYEHPPYKDLKFKTFDAAEYWSKNALFLPFGNGLNHEQCDLIACYLKRFESKLYSFKTPLSKNLK